MLLSPLYLLVRRCSAWNDRADISKRRARAAGTFFATYNGLKSVLIQLDAVPVALVHAAASGTGVSTSLPQVALVAHQLE